MDSTHNKQALKLIIDAINPLKNGGWLNEEHGMDLFRLATALAVDNKIFPEFYDDCMKLGIEVPSSMHQLATDLMNRKRAQAETMAELARISKMMEIEFMVVKTFRPFNYVGDDVDLLVKDYRALKIFVNALLTKGYAVKSIGTPEIVVHKRCLGTVVDVDIHHRMAAGYIPYVEAQALWDSRVGRKINEEEIFAPSPLYELLITIGHSLLKELRLRIVDLYHLVIGLNSFQPDYLYNEALKNGLGGCMRIFSIAADILWTYLSQDDLNLCSSTRWPKSNFDAMILHRISKSNLNLPYIFPLDLVFAAYAEKFRYELRGRGLNALIDFGRMPSAKGIAKNLGLAA